MKSAVLLTLILFCGVLALDGIRSSRLSFSHRVQLERELASDTEVAVLITFGNSNKRSDEVPTQAEISHGWSLLRSRIDAANAKRSEGSVIKVSRAFIHFPVATLRVTAEGLRELSTMDGVITIEHDRMFRTAMAEVNDLIGAKAVYTPSMGGNSSYNGQGWTVAVFDNGFQTDHPFLAGKAVVDACFSSDFTCPNGGSSMIGEGASYITDGNHGTHVAGTVAGNLLPNGLSGVAPGANMILVRVFDEDGGSATSSQLAGYEMVLNYTATLKIAAISMSIGSDEGYSSNCDSEDVAHTSAIKALRSKNIPVVIASGNEYRANQIGSPACISYAISVGATTKSDTSADFSNVASFLTLMAPGVKIYSSDLNKEYTYLDGTSMATPAVSGAIAVLRSAFGAGPSVDDLIKRLQDTGKNVYDAKTGLTKKRIDLKAAMWKNAQSCGDGKVQAGEQCDDGNIYRGDGCTPQCYREALYTCTDNRCSFTASRPLSEKDEPLSQVDVGEWTASAGVYTADSENGESGLIVRVPKVDTVDGSSQRLVLEFTVSSSSGVSSDCINNLVVLANGQVLRSLDLPYNGLDTATIRQKNSSYIGLSGYCSSVALNQGKATMDVSSFVGRPFEITFLSLGTSTFSSQFQVEDIRLRQLVYNADTPDTASTRELYTFGSTGPVITPGNTATGFKIGIYSLLFSALVLAAL